ncbi:sulfotransferase family protein [Ruegeria arenilitoris]|uniref:sulfotransferase family protein n=1 Tax=Ruegeria arenilitoris TaxID=1173585 RepID=UPI001480F412|nr:sulfotransferase [Ruegeria arenilitoris]
MAKKIELGRPIFITGVQRSGTTLLRTVICAHPEIWISYECAFYRVLGEKYLDGIPRGRQDEFVNDIFAVKRFDYWRIPRENVRKILADCDEDPIPFLWVIGRLAEENLEVHKPQACHFGFKNPHGIYHVDYIWRLFPEARVINIIRDPRGILSSEKNRKTEPGEEMSASAIWTVRTRFKKMHEAHTAHVDDPRYLALSYSDLIQNFEETVRKTLDFLEVPFDAKIFDYDANARETSLVPDGDMHLHALTLRKPDPTRLHAYRKTLTAREQAALETLLIRRMDSLLGVGPEYSWLQRTVATSVFAQRLLREKAWPIWSRYKRRMSASGT